MRLSSPVPNVFHEFARDLPEKLILSIEYIHTTQTSYMISVDDHPFCWQFLVIQLSLQFTQ